MSDDPFSLGVLLDEPAMGQWAAEAVEMAVSETDVNIELALVSDTDDAGQDRSWKSYASSALGKGAWAPILAWHRMVNTPEHYRKVSIDEVRGFEDAAIHRASPEPADGFGQRLPSDAIERIESMDLDALFRRGFGVLKGDVLTAPSHGVLSFHHGNLREYRGRPPGVWEFANDERYAGVTLQQLTPTLDGGRIVVEKRVKIAGLPTWQSVERELFDHSTDMLARACERLGNPSFSPSTVDELGPLYTCPGPVDAARIELKNARGRVQTRLGL